MPGKGGKYRSRVIGISAIINASRILGQRFEHFRDICTTTSVRTRVIELDGDLGD